MFCVRVLLPGGVYGRMCTHEHACARELTRTYTVHVHTLEYTIHLVSITEMGAACQLCPIPLLLTGNARGAGQTRHTQDKGAGGL